MTIDDWLVAATTDADRRDLPALKPLLGMLADATRTLRTASWNHDAAGPPPAGKACASGTVGGETSLEPDTAAAATYPDEP